MRLGAGSKSTIRYCILDIVILVVNIRWAMVPSVPPVPTPMLCNCGKYLDDSSDDLIT